jgi:hypothetical protein
MLPHAFREMHDLLHNLKNGESQLVKRADLSITVPGVAQPMNHKAALFKVSRLHKHAEAEAHCALQAASKQLGTPPPPTIAREVKHRLLISSLLSTQVCLCVCSRIRLRCWGGHVWRMLVQPTVLYCFDKRYMTASHCCWLCCLVPMDCRACYLCVC